MRDERQRTRGATRRGSSLLSCGLLFGLSGEVAPAWAQDEESAPSEAELVSGDNPGFTNVTSPAPRLTLITEQMVTASFLPDDVEVALPNLMARVGLLDWLEVRAILPSAILTFPEGARMQLGVDQISVGAVFASSFGESLSGSLVPMLVVPIAPDDEVGALGVEGNVQANVSLDISEQWSFSAAVRGGWVRCLLRTKLLRLPSRRHG